MFSHCSRSPRLWQLKGEISLWAQGVTFVLPACLPRLQCVQDTGLCWGRGPACQEPANSLVGGRGGNWALLWRGEEYQGGWPPQMWEESRKKWYLHVSHQAPRSNHGDRRFRAQLCSQQTVGAVGSATQHLPSPVV